MKKFLFLSFLVASLASSLFGADLLASLTNGKISDNSPGVKVLSLDEAKQVKGGYIYSYSSKYNGYIVKTNNNSQQNLSLELGYNKNVVIVAKYRYLNGKQYYLTAYHPDGTISGPASWGANRVLRDFMSKF